MTTTTDVLFAELDAGILTITLNRADKLNSLTLELIDELAVTARDAASNDDVRCVVLTGSGRAFSAGAALAGDPAEFDVRGVLRDHYNPAALALYELDKPVIASIRGIAGGAGASLTLACDLRIAADDAKIAILFRRIGAATDMGASFFLPRIVGAGRAAELALLGDDISATDARAMGLFNRIVPAAELDAATRELASRLATGPSSQTQIKRQLRASLHNTFAEQLDLEYETQGIASDSEDMIEGISAFLERRPARFRGR